MVNRHVDIEQGTDEWHRVRLGKLTASRVHDALCRLKNGGFSASREKYKVHLCYARLNKKPYPQFITPAMRFGTENQAWGEDQYGLRMNVPVDKIGFVDHPTIAMAGCSPDGLIGDDGLIEIKVPESHTHWNTWDTGVISEEYIYQMRWQFACMPERQWCDFVSCDPRIEEEEFQLGQFLRIRLQRSDHQAAIDKMEADAVVFLQEVDAVEARMRKKWRPAYLDDEPTADGTHPGLWLWQNAAAAVQAELEAKRSVIPV